MPNPFVKGWKYVMALFDSTIDEHADPKVQIHQAIDAAQQQHRDLSEQAAAVIGNQRRLEMRLNRAHENIGTLQDNARNALGMAEQARAGGDEAKATEYEQSAEAFAAQLVTAENEAEDLTAMHNSATQATAEAKQAVEQNEMALQEQMDKRGKLLGQLEQAKMQEQVSESLQSISGIAGDGNTPTLNSVRDKIEHRYATALGAAELSGDSVQGRMREVQQSSHQMAGRSRLDAIRADMRSELPDATSADTSTPAHTAEQQEAGRSRLEQLRADMHDD